MGKRVLALFVVTYLLTLLITAPASLLDSVVQYATGGRLMLAHAQGTIWNGAATPALRGRTANLITLEPMHWDVAVLPLFTGKMQLSLQWDDFAPGQTMAAPAMEAMLTFKQIELQHVLLLLPARILEELSPILKPAQFRGQFHIQSERLVLTKNNLHGSAVVDWQQASSALSSIAPLGNYRVTLNGAGERVNIGLSTPSGVLLLNGQGFWSAAHGLEFHGTAQAAAGKHESLTELLHHLGPEASPGVHNFNLVPP